MSEKFGKATNLATGLGILISGVQYYTATNDDDKIKYGADIVFGLIGIIPDGGQIISAFWFLGGRELVFQYGETMGKLMKDGINPGYPVYQPFK